MENNDYFTEKIAPKKHNENRPPEKRAERQDKPHRKDFSRKPSQMVTDNPPIDLTMKADENSPRVEIIGVRFKDVGKVYYFSPVGLKFTPGAPVIVKTARGTEYGTVAFANKTVLGKEVVQPLRPVERAATKDDIAR